MNTALFCGLTTIDVVNVVDEVPTANQKVVSTETRIDVGGPAANAARTAAALGVPARLVTLLGNSAFARLALEQLFAEGIEVIDLAADDNFPVSTVLLDAQGKRTVISRNNPERKFVLPDSSVLDDVAILEIDGHFVEVQEQYASYCKKREIPVVFDGGSWKRGTGRLLPLIDHAIISADFEVPNISAPTLQYLSQYKYQLLAQTHGDEPIQAFTGEQATSLPIPRVRVADTLGAGDVLHGAYTALLPQATNPLTALRQASIMATKSTQFHGVLTWIENEREF